MRFSINPYILLTLAVLFWAGNHVTARGIHEEISPFALNFWRWVSCFVIFLPFGLKPVRAAWPMIRANWKTLLGLGLMGISLNQAFVYKAVQTTTAVNSSLIYSITPAVIPVMAYFILRERVQARQVAGIALSMVGVALIVVKADLDVLRAFQFTEGDFWMLGAVTTWAMYSVLLNRLPADFPPFALFLSVVASGVIMMTPFYIGETVAFGGYMNLNTEVFVALGYMAVLASIAAYMSWNRGIAQVGSTRGGLFMHTMPVFAALLSWIFLGEGVRGYHAAGVVLIAWGLYLTTTATHTFRRWLTARFG